MHELSKPLFSSKGSSVLPGRSGPVAELFCCAVTPYSMSPLKNLQSVWSYDFSFALLLSELHETASTWNTVLRET